MFILLGTCRNIGKNSLYGPVFYDWNVDLFKNSLFTEGRRMRFRTEFFKGKGGTTLVVFNGANCNDPNTSLSNLSPFGASTSAGDPRIRAIGAKVFLLVFV